MPGTRKSTAFPVGPRGRAIAEDHLIGRAEQQQPAGNLEDGMPIPEVVQQSASEQRDHHQNRSAISGGAADRAKSSMPRWAPGTLERWRAD